jgi:hypothetical protein
MEIRRRRSLIGRYTFLHKADGEIEETDLIIERAVDWDISPESSDRAWSVVRTGPYVLALKSILPTIH